MFEISIKESFAAAHYIRNYPGDCSRLHGHTWFVEVGIRGEDLDGLGMLMDFSKLKQMVRQQIKKLDHQLINEIEAFKDQQLNPTAENLARHLYEQIAMLLSVEIPDRCVKLSWVTVWESPTAWAKYWRNE